MKKNEVFYCIGCGTTHARESFYKSFNPIHKNGVYPYCKKFIKDAVYNSDGSIDLVKFQNLLRQIDAPFLSEIWLASVNSKQETIGAYFRMLAMPHYKDMTWQNTSTPLNKTDNINEKKQINQDAFNDDFEVTQEMLHRWGSNYNANQIRDLEKFYQDMHMTHAIVTPEHEKALILICKMQLKLDGFLETDDMTSFSKLHGEYQKLLQSSGLRPIDKIGGDEATGMRSFSQIFEEVEKNGFIKPVPVEENQDIVDKTIQYIINYTLKLLNQQILTEPPVDTPKIDEADNDGEL